MFTGHLPNQLSLRSSRCNASPRSSSSINTKLSSSSTTDSPVYYSQGPPPSSPPVVPSENKPLFILRTPSPHPELSPPHAARSRSWSHSSSSNLTSSPIVPTGGLVPHRRGSSQYFTPAGSLRSWSSLQPPFLAGNSSQISGGSPALAPQAPPARGAEAGYFGTEASVLLSSLFTPAREAQTQTHSSTQKRYTEDWVLHRGYQQHRRSGSSLCAEVSDESTSDEDIYSGAHRRNVSNAKTITPADFYPKRALVIPETELSSDAGTGVSGGAEAWKTAPQSLIEVRTQSPAMPLLPSRWATTPTTPTSMEIISEKSNGFRVEEHPNSDMSVFGVENGLDANMLRTTSSSTEATTTPHTNGFAASLLLPIDQPISISRSQTPNLRSVKRCKGRNVIIQIPSETPWGLPLEEGGRPMPLTGKQIKERTKLWEAQGYTVEFLNEHNGQSRNVFPEQTLEKAISGEIAVSIPDRRDWETYCTALREEKLRALGVILGEEAPTTTPAVTRGQTPQSHHQSPAPYHVNSFSPPQPTSSAMSNPMGSQNGNGINYHSHHYSPSLGHASLHGPIGHMPPPIGPPSNHHLAFHIPRQSMSMSTTPINNHDWDPYAYTPPPQSQPTPPMMNVSGVWSPGPFAMRNGSPMGGMGHHNHSQSMSTPQYMMEENVDYMQQHNEYVENQRAAYYGHNHYHSLVGMDRYHPQMHRSSPLAQVGHTVQEVEDENMMNDMMSLDAPVPQHRHHLSISLQKDIEGMENYQKDIETHIVNGHHQPNGFNTNPVSPAPEVMYPQHPAIPNVENDVHNGPELLSGAEEGVSDVETERRQNQQAARERTQSIVGMGAQYLGDNIVSMSEGHYIPQQQYHSRDTSLSHMQQQQQYDATDPRENSAMAMLMAGDGLGAGSHLGTGGIGGRGGFEELLSEDGRTNISDTLTNPSAPPSPRPRYTQSSHIHNISNSSNAWMSDTSKPAGSVTSSTTKFNAQAKEFKYNPPATFPYSPQSKPFIPSSSVVSSPGSAGAHSRNASGGFGGFGGLGSKFTGAALPFRPSLFSSGSFGKGVFSPDAPEFKPGSAVAPLPPASTSPTGLPLIFAQTEEVVLPPLEDKVLVHSPSRLTHSETSADETGDVREGSVSEGGRKRAKHGPTLSAVRDTEVPTLESLQPAETNSISTAGSEHDIADEETIVEGSETSDEAEEVMKELLEKCEPLVTIHEGETRAAPEYEFRNVEEAAAFATADSGMSAPSRHGTIFDVLDKEMSLEEAQLVATPLSSAQSTIQPTVEEFNFNFSQLPKSVSPVTTKKFGMGESRYAHTPSPPPTHPAPPPPTMEDVTVFELPAHSSPIIENDDPCQSEEPAARLMPTDSELDEVIQQLTVDDPIYQTQGIEYSESEEEQDEEEEEVAPWKRDTPKRLGIPLFREPTPTPLENPFEQAERSAAPSPSPRRGFFGHRASSFSTDEAYGHVQTTSEVTYRPPIQEDMGTVNIDSDWNDMIEGEEDIKLRPQSRLFFDSHVEELVDGLLQSRLDPVDKRLSAIHEVLKGYSIALDGRRGSISTSAVHSDADDEDDNQPLRSPRKDKRTEKIKSAVVEALVMHDWGATEDKLAELHDAIVEVSRACQDINLGDDLAETKTSILNALTVRAGELDLVKTDILAAIRNTANANDMDKLRSGFDRSVSTLAQVRDIASIREALEDMFGVVAQTGDIQELRDALARSAQKTDTDQLRASIADVFNKVAHKEDLEHFQNIAIDVFSKVVKTNDLVELKNMLLEVLRTVHGVDVKNDVQKLSYDNAAFRQTLSDVLKLTQNNAENIDFHQESQEGVIKAGHAIMKESLGAVHMSVMEVTKLVQQRGSKEDMLRSLQKEDQYRSFANIMTAVEKVRKTVDSVVERVPGMEDIRKISESQPRLEDIRSAVEEVVKTQHTIEDVRIVVEEIAGKQPTLRDVRLIVEEVTSKQPSIEELRLVVEEAHSKQMEFVRSAVEEATSKQPSIEELRFVVEEAASRQPSIEELRFAVDEVASNQPGLSDVKSVMVEVVDTLPKMDDLRSMISQLLTQHQTVEVARIGEQVNHQELQLRVEGLEKILDETESRAEGEARARREANEKALEMESRLRIAEEEAARYRGMAEESDRRLKAIDDKRHQTLTQTQMRSALLEGAHSSLQKSVGDLSARNASLEGSLREAQQSSERHREESARVEDENRELRRAIESTKAEMEESIRVREGFRGKFDKLQGDMQTAAYEIGQEQGKWRKVQEEQKARIKVLEARVGAEATVKENLESEVRRLEVEQKEAIKLKVEFEQTKRSNAKLEELLDKLKEEAMEQSQRTAALTHEVDSARESAHDEVARVRESLQRDIDAANTEVNAVRAALERDIEQARYEVDRVVQEATIEKEKFSLSLRESADAKRAALDELEEAKAALAKDSAEDRSVALQEQHRKYERQLSELRQQVEDTRSQHDRALRIATEDRERDKSFLTERLNNAQTESKHLREYTSHLKEQVKFATTAAQAAAQAAQSAKGMMAPNPHTSEDRALRESLDVLQTQLQQREARIEGLEQQLSKFDKTDIKRKDEQITWLRELLEVRIDELEEIVHSLSLPHFDRESVRDTALRLKTNLQMEQREKEIAMAGSRPAPAAVSLASRLPGVANSAASWWNSKNKGPSSTTAQSSTPSRPHSAAGFLNGILTPPSTTLANAQRIGSRFAKGISSETASNSSQNTITSRQRDKQAAVMPSSRRDNNASSSRRGTIPPQLFRRGSYDADADESVMSAEYYPDEDDATETADDGETTPFRPSFYRH